MMPFIMQKDELLQPALHPIYIVFNIFLMLRMKVDRKVAIVGKSLQVIFDIGIKLEYLHVHDEIIIPISEIKIILKMKL